MKHKPVDIGQELVDVGLFWRVAVKEESDCATESDSAFDLKTEWNK